MRKTDRKIENGIREALTEVCDVALKDVEGFKWLTHFVNYNAFPDSLSVVCVFDKQSDLSLALVNHHDEFIRSLIGEKLRALGVQIKDIGRQVSFDTEEDCDIENDGNWKARFR
ncbi:Fis family transcriptional regulator [Halioglobus maricola]|uniref:Fis family transcriptional regulator n=1 Tax=Halioglobus maricola TaxID=2601894 RepID=A0A5P9NNP0_9GAMM|nr:Fis family transcriptional regulator [Halioglobus maricola]QFU77065.1 Fis family transcriptional regulator [Halioglobus maricola]